MHHLALKDPFLSITHNATLQELFIAFPARNVVSCTSKTFFKCLCTIKMEDFSFPAARHFSSDVYNIKDICVCVTTCCYGSNYVRKNSSLTLLEPLNPVKRGHVLTTTITSLVFFSNINSQRLCLLVFLIILFLWFLSWFEYSSLPLQLTLLLTAI